MKQAATRVFAVLALFVGARAQTDSASHTSEIQAHMTRAEAALGANDQQAAAAEFRVVLTIDPKNVQAHANLGIIEFFRGDCPSAARDLRQAVAAHPSLAKPQALLGVCQKRMGDAAAKQTLAAAFAKLTEVKLRTQVGMELAALYQQDGDLEHTASIIGALVGLNPEDPNILYFAQRTYSVLAGDTLNKLAIVAPGSARMQQTIAEALVNAGDLKGAIEHYRNALEIDPRIPGLRYELAEAILESAPSDAAIQAEAEKGLNDAIACEGDSPGIQCELGAIATRRSDQQGAYNHYSQALRLNPHDSCGQLGLGRTLMTIDKAQEARKYLELAVASDPLNSEAHYRLALAYRNLQMSEQAQKEMHLFQEIRKTKDQVKVLYRQMKREAKPESEDSSDLPASQ